MTRPSEDDPAAIDRAFAEMMAGYHLTADRPADAPAQDAISGGATTTTEPSSGPGPGPGSAEGADRVREQLPLFHFPSEQERQPDPEPPEDDLEPFVPEPLPPLGSPALPALLGWLGIGWAALVVLAAAFGARFPSWMGWVAVVGFLGGFAVLVARLPRQRPPGSGDGAVL